MEVRSAVWLLTALLLDLISAEDQNSLKYLEVGGKLALRPEPVSDPIRNITWKLSGNMLGVLDEGQELVYSPVFGDRVKVDKTTGVLEISNMMKTDSGVYTVSINDRIQSGRYDVRVIKQVPKPMVMLTPETCTKESKNCFLSCGGDVTEAGPVTFYFKKGNGGWEERMQYVTILNDKDTQAVKMLSCRMKNPLGQKDSDPVKNPFYVEPGRWKIVVVFLGVLAAVAALIAAGSYCNNQQKLRTDPTAASPNISANHPKGRLLNVTHPENA